MVTLSKNLIEKLYYKEGLSVIELSKKLRISPWIVFAFMRKNNIARRSFFEANQKNFGKKPLSFSIRKNLSSKEKELKIAGILIYWAEGAKPNNKGCTVDFANSNTQMIRLFLRFLRVICRVDEKRLRVQLYCYSNQGVENLKKYWYKETHIPLNQFIKPYVRNDFLPEKSGKMKYGMVHIRYADKKLLYQIGDWIKKYCLKNNI
jgi:hypothetical protein